MRGSGQRSVGAGFAVHFVKPFDPGHLIQAIERVAAPRRPLTASASTRSLIQTIERVVATNGS